MLTHYDGHIRTLLPLTLHQFGESMCPRWGVVTGHLAGEPGNAGLVQPQTAGTTIVRQAAQSSRPCLHK